MRGCLLVLFCATLAFSQDPQPVAPPPHVPDNLSIPAQLSKAVSSEKCKAGDVVEMRTLEPVLIGKGLVMPENAKLLGRILGAGSRQADRPSWLVLVVERAEWKEHSLPLHAFITAQITIKRKQPGSSTGALGGLNPSQSEPVRRRRSARMAAQNNPGNDLAVAMANPPEDSTVTGDDSLPATYHPLDDVHILRDKDGTIFLLSQKRHLKLPPGTMLILRNHPLAASEASARKVADSAR